MPFGKIRGRHGEVRVPSLGAVIGRFDGQGGYWELVRRPDGQQQGKPVVYRLSAVFSYLNHGLWSHDRVSKELVIEIGSELFRVDPVEGQQMVLQGRTLQVEGVTLCPLSQP